MLPEDEADALRMGFTVMGRASATAPAVVRPWIMRMLRAGELVVRAPAALEAAKVTGHRTAFSVLGQVLAEQYGRTRPRALYRRDGLPLDV